jgi:hypothetical protein
MPACVHLGAGILDGLDLGLDVAGAGRHVDGPQEALGVCDGPAGAQQSPGQAESRVVAVTAWGPVSGQQRRGGQAAASDAQLIQGHPRRALERVPDDGFARGVDAGRHDRLAPGRPQLKEQGLPVVGLVLIAGGGRVKSLVGILELGGGLFRRVSHDVPVVRSRFAGAAGNHPGCGEEEGGGEYGLEGVEVHVDETGGRLTQQQAEVAGAAVGEVGGHVGGSHAEVLPALEAGVLVLERDRHRHEAALQVVWRRLSGSGRDLAVGRRGVRGL